MLQNNSTRCRDFGLWSHRILQKTFDTVANSSRMRYPDYMNGYSCANTATGFPYGKISWRNHDHHRVNLFLSFPWFVSSLRGWSWRIPTSPSSDISKWISIRLNENILTSDVLHDIQHFEPVVFDHRHDRRTFDGEVIEENVEHGMVHLRDHRILESITQGDSDPSDHIGDFIPTFDDSPMFVYISFLLLVQFFGRGYHSIVFQEHLQQLRLNLTDLTEQVPLDFGESFSGIFRPLLSKSFIHESYHALWIVNPWSISA